MYRVVTYIVEQNRYIQRGPGIENASCPASALVKLGAMMYPENKAMANLHFAECMDAEGNSQWRLSAGADQ